MPASIVVAAVAVVVGLAVLVRAADAFVVAAEVLALRLRWSAAIIGAVVVGFGTSLPELVASVMAALVGEPDLAIGNAAGSNVANLLLVLGLAVLVRPVAMAARGSTREVVGAGLGGVLLLGLSLDGGLGPVDGALLVASLGVLVGWQVRAGATQRLEVPVSVGPRGGRWLGVRLSAGLVGVIVGAQALVWGASTLATEAGVPTIVVGSVLVALGTSLPELATAVASARRGQAELLLGNLIGSNAFNALGVVGASALVGVARGDRLAVDAAALAVVAAAAVVTAVVGAITWARPRLGRVAGAVLVACYLAAVPALVAIS